MVRISRRQRRALNQQLFKNIKNKRVKRLFSLILFFGIEPAVGALLTALVAANKRRGKH